MDTTIIMLQLLCYMHLRPDHSRNMVIGIAFGYDVEPPKANIT